METRRIERERVLSLLYESEMKRVGADDVLQELPVPPDDFVAQTVRGVGGAVSELDVAIERYATHWKVERMAVIDRNIMRIAAWELLNRPELPIAVVISEAVELAKRFSTDESGAFVNGVLSAMAADVRAG